MLGIASLVCYLILIIKPSSVECKLGDSCRINLITWQSDTFVFFPSIIALRSDFGYFLFFPLPSEFKSLEIRFCQVGSVCMVPEAGVTAMTDFSVSLLGGIALLNTGAVEQTALPCSFMQECLLFVRFELFFLCKRVLY